MSVTFDANATASTLGNGILGTTGVTSTALTVGSAANRALVVALAFSNTAITSVVVTWDSGGTNQAMTQIITANSTQPTMSRLYGLVAPTSGAKTLKVTWNAVNSDVIMNGTSFAAADQTGGVTTFPNSGSATGNSTAPALTVTSATGNFTISTSSCDTAGYSAEGNTSDFQNNGGTGVCGAGERATGAATVSHTYTIASGPWVVVGTDILAAAASTDNQEWLTRNFNPKRPTNLAVMY